MSGQPFLPLYGKDRPSLERQNERVMIERREKEDIEIQIYKDISFPLVPSPSEIGKEVLVEVIEVLGKSLEPYSCLIIEHQGDCCDFSRFHDGFVGSAYLFETINVIVCIPESDETRN